MEKGAKGKKVPIVIAKKSNKFKVYVDGQELAQYKNEKEARKNAKELIKDSNIGLVIEPLNLKDNPGYFLTKIEQAKEICELVGSDSVKIMFDFYHIQINQGNVLERFREHLPYIGHVQIASVQDRSEPDKGELDFNYIIPEIYKIGYKSIIGAEYKPKTTTEEGLGWMKRFN